MVGWGNQIKGDATGGRTFKAMNKVALSNDAIVKRVELYKYRVPEELDDFKNDTEGLVNNIDESEFQDELKKLKELLYLEKKRTNDP